MTRTEILDAARDAVAARQEIYGGPEDSFGAIAELWRGYLNGLKRPLGAFDVAMMMALLKIARARESPGHADNLIDIAGYAACAAEGARDAGRVTPGRE